ncbi:MAG: NAD(P)/FAD-dependent oxidoreductase, partial [Candidatus Binatia bacterium]
DFCRSALARYGPADFIALVERHGIPYHEKKLGQLFCDGSSREIIAMLLAECRAAGVDIRLGCATGAIRKGAAFTVETSHGSFESGSLVIATGGLSIPKVGATDFGYRVARQFGLRIVEPKAGLVPLTFGEPGRAVFGELAGISFDSIVACDGARFRENTLFTHRGLSGPAVLQISSYWDPGKAITIELLPGVDLEALFDSARWSAMELTTLLGRHLSRRLVIAWTGLHVGSKPMNRYGPRELEAIAAKLRAWRIDPAGTEGYGKAEVTCGGVDTAELSSRTMEARRVPGLHFIGEVVDVTGHLGGHNFQWAWASGSRPDSSCRTRPSTWGSISPTGSGSSFSRSSVSIAGRFAPRLDLAARSLRAAFFVRSLLPGLPLLASALDPRRLLAYPLPFDGAFPFDVQRTVILLHRLAACLAPFGVAALHVRAHHFPPPLHFGAHHFPPLSPAALHLRRHRLLPFVAAALHVRP